MTTITLDFRYVQFDYELWALSHMLDTIEPTIEALAAEDEFKTLEDLRESGWADDEAERDLALQDIREKRDDVLPRFMRGPFVVALWACYESGVGSIAKGLREETSAPIELDELKGDSFLSRAGRYFEAILGIPLDADDPRLQRLKNLYRVRNGLAHANGLQEGMTPKEWRRLLGALSQQGAERKSVERGAVVLTPEYVRAAYDDVSESLKNLLARARSHRQSHSAQPDGAPEPAR